jgi:hypothetical protein
MLPEDLNECLGCDGTLHNNPCHHTIECEHGKDREPLSPHKALALDAAHAKKGPSHSLPICPRVSCALVREEKLVGVVHK